MAEIHTSVVALVAQQLGIDTGPIADQACQGRTGKRHRAEIRVLLAFASQRLQIAKQRWRGYGITESA